ncbi:MAG: type II toxin-antitoxin system RelE/ParE family toxin [Saprospiraceae bacterium]|nr:type II toxin-antitoxin system RelE/ParE family toxin [Saprospiraceae bacterium]
MSDGLYDVCWDFKAGEDLDQIYKYLLENASENVAKKVKKEIVSAVSHLRQYPESYPLDPLLRSRPEKFHYIRIWKYKIVYEFTGKECIITRIFHFSQDLNKAYEDFDK